MNRLIASKKILKAAATCEIPAECYSGKSIDGDVYAVHSAINFQNNIYISIFYEKGRTREVRIYMMEKSTDGKGTLSFDVTKPKYTITLNYNLFQIASNISLIEFNQQLYVFYILNTQNSVSGQQARYLVCQILNKDLKKVTDFVFNSMKGPICLGVTVVNNILHLVLQDEKSNVLNIMKGNKVCLKETDFSITGRVQHGWEILPNDDDPNDIGSIHYEDLVVGTMDRWSVSTWHGKSTQRFIVGMASGKKLSTYIYDGHYWGMTQYFDTGAEFDIIGLELVQAAIGGITVGEENPMQFIYCSYSYKNKKKLPTNIQIVSYFPDHNSSWSSKITNTSIPYGSLAVTTSLEYITSGDVDNHNELFQQYIYIIRGNYDDTKVKYYVGQITSNQFRIKKSKFNMDWTEHRTNKELRKLMPIKMIVEGPPPTFVNSEEWFKHIFSVQPYPPYLTSLTVEKEVKKGTKYALSLGSEIGYTIGYEESDYAAKVGLLTEFKARFDVDRQVETSTSFEFNLSYYDSRENGSIFYQVPVLQRIDVSVYDYTGYILIPGLVSLSKITCIDFKLYEEKYKLSDKPSCIENPYELKSWAERAINVDPYLSPIISFSNTMGGIGENFSSKETINLQSEKSVAKLNTFDMGIPFFQIETKESWEFSISSTCEISQKLEVITEEFTTSDIPETYKIASYSAYLYSLGQSKTMYKEFLQRLKDTNRISSVDGNSIVVLCWMVDQIHER